MRKLGTPSHVTTSGLLVVPISEPPPIGATIVTKSKKVIGSVFDVIGPVNKPFAVVKLHNKKSISALLEHGESLFFIMKKKQITRGQRKKKRVQSKSPPKR